MDPFGMLRPLAEAFARHPTGVVFCVMLTGYFFVDLVRDCEATKGIPMMISMVLFGFLMVAALPMMERR